MEFLKCIRDLGKHVIGESRCLRKISEIHKGSDGDEESIGDSASGDTEKVVLDSLMIMTSDLFEQ